MVPDTLGAAHPPTPSSPRRAAGYKWKDLKKIVVADRNAARTKSKMLEHWPVNGSVIFDNVVMRYRPTARPALDGVNLSIKHGEKARSLAACAPSQHVLAPDIPISSCVLLQHKHAFHAFGLPCVPRTIERCMHGNLPAAPL